MWLVGSETWRLLDTNHLLAAYGGERLHREVVVVVAVLFTDGAKSILISGSSPLLHQVYSAVEPLLSTILSSHPPRRSFC